MNLRADRFVCGQLVYVFLKELKFFGYFYEYRTGFSGNGKVIGFVNGGDQFTVRGNQEITFCNSVNDVFLVYLVKLVISSAIPSCAAADDKHGNTVKISFSYSGHGM